MSRSIVVAMFLYGGLEGYDGEKWMDRLPEFKAWIASLSEKTLYKHLLESLNVAAESDEGTGLIEQLSGADLAALTGSELHKNMYVFTQLCTVRL